jgi:predicted nucleic acid-binding Zn ribbon protein
MKRRDPQPIGELFDQLFKSPNIAAKIAEGGLPNTWREVVGPIVAEYTRQVRFVQGTLYVHVTSAVIRSELMMQRDALVRAINARAGIEIVKQVVVQ